MGELQPTLQISSNSNFGFFKKEIIKGRAQRPAPTWNFSMVL